MRIVPVIDLMAGRAVAARGGDRRSYRPLLSRLGGGLPAPLDDPGTLAALYRRALGPAWVYIADLDRIERTGDNAAALAAIHAAAPALLLWDGGLADRAELEAAPRRVTPPGPLAPILASETLASPEGLRPPAGAGRSFWIGLDLASAGLRAAAPSVRALGEMTLLQRAVEAGAAGAVLVMVDGIGTGAGLPLARIARLRAAAPGIPFCAGGGIATMADLAALRDAGVDGALVASALHDGRLTPAALAEAGFA